MCKWCDESDDKCLFKKIALPGWLYLKIHFVLSIFEQKTLSVG